MVGLAIVALLGGHHGHHGHSHGTSHVGAAASAAWLLDDDGKPWRDVGTMTREELLLEDQRLHDTRPGVGGSITLLILGVIVAITGVGFSIGGAIDTFATSAFSWALGVGLGCIAAGIVLFIAGAAVLIGALATRQRYDARMEVLDRQLQVVDPELPPKPESSAPIREAPLMTLATF